MFALQILIEVMIFSVAASTLVRRRAESACVPSSLLGTRSSKTSTLPLDTPVIDSNDDTRELVTIELHKGTVGLGFCIEGGRDSPRGDTPITVKRLFKGMPSKLCLGYYFHTEL